MSVRHLRWPGKQVLESLNYELWPENHERAVSCLGTHMFAIEIGSGNCLHQKMGVRPTNRAMLTRVLLFQQRS